MCYSEWIFGLQYFPFVEQYVPCVVNQLFCLLRDLSSVFLWCWIKSEGYRRKVDTQNELLGRIMDAVTRVKRYRDELGREGINRLGTMCINIIV